MSRELGPGREHGPRTGQPAEEEVPGDVPGGPGRGLDDRAAVVRLELGAGDHELLPATTTTPTAPIGTAPLVPLGSRHRVPLLPRRAGSAKERAKPPTSERAAA